MPAVPSYEQYTCFNIPSFWHSSAADKLRTAERLAQCPYCHGELVRYVDSRFYPVPHIPTEKAHAASSSRDSHDALSFWRDKANLSLAVGQSSSGDQQDEFVAVCKTCGFWFGRGGRDSGPFMGRTAYGIIKRYDIASLDVPIRELVLYLSRDQKDLTSINPFKAEELMERLLADKFRCGVHRIGGRKDRGIDLLLKSNSEVKTIVQIKWHRDVMRAESVRVVRELCGTLVSRGIPRGMLVTTRKYLSREGLSEISDIAASPVAPGRFSISVVDYERILELLELTANKMGSFSTPPKHLVEAVSKDSPSGIYNFKGTTRYEYQRTKHGARWRETF